MLTPTSFLLPGLCPDGPSSERQVQLCNLQGSVCHENAGRDPSFKEQEGGVSGWPSGLRQKAGRKAFSFLLWPFLACLGMFHLPFKVSLLGHDNTLWVTFIDAPTLLPYLRPGSPWGRGQPSVLGTWGSGPTRTQWRWDRTVAEASSP